VAPHLSELKDVEGPQRPLVPDSAQCQQPTTHTAPLTHTRAVA
jgi:hypothetical protein